MITKKEVKKYNVIYADPPWSYSQKSAGRGNKSGAIDKYPTMALTEICSLPIQDLISDEAVCFLWCTTPLMDYGFATMKAWGFKYKTLIVWEKTGLLGMGNYLRVQTEFILIGVKGKVKPFKHQERNIYKHRVGKHSEKPDFFRLKVEELSLKSFEQVNKLELFARHKMRDWEVYGNEVSDSIQLFGEDAA